MDWVSGVNVKRDFKAEVAKSNYLVHLQLIDHIASTSAKVHAVMVNKVFKQSQ